MGISPFGGLDPLPLFIMLCAVHFVCDFVIQGEVMALGKNRHIPASTPVPWAYWMTAHTACHAVGVFLLTRNVPMACLEWAAHWIIDALKCEHVFGFHTDQALHIATKAAIVMLLLRDGA
jgi:hypothetical protein